MAGYIQRPDQIFEEKHLVIQMVQRKFKITAKGKALKEEYKLTEKLVKRYFHWAAVWDEEERTNLGYDAEYLDSIPNSKVFDLEYVEREWGDEPKEIQATLKHLISKGFIVEVR